MIATTIGRNVTKNGVFSQVTTGILASMLEPEDLARETTDAVVDRLRGVLLAKSRFQGDPAPNHRQWNEGRVYEDESLHPCRSSRLWRDKPGIRCDH